jgi:large subunit ribosomal protein L10
VHKEGSVQLAITRERKGELVQQYADLITRNAGIVLTSFSGLSVKQTEELRGKIREMGGEFHIVKNTLAKLAFDQAGLDIPEKFLLGTTAIGFANEDIPALAKAIVDLSKETEALSIKVGVLEGEVIDGAQVVSLAELPPLTTLQAQIIGLIQTPARQVASALASSIRQLIHVTNAYAQRESEGANAPAG